jgi:hypothetical protein
MTITPDLNLTLNATLPATVDGYAVDRVVVPFHGRSRVVVAARRERIADFGFVICDFLFVICYLVST